MTRPVPLWAVVGLVVVTATLAATVTATLGPDDPNEGSIEAGFARDMSAHHAQAVEMSELVRARTDDSAIAALATDIALTQQAQIGRMQGWLALWDLPQTRVGPRMTWMGHPTDGLMPGMATRAQLNELAEAEGETADRLFLELMMEHHQAGIHMAEAASDRTGVDDVGTLADAMIAGQRAEIEAMRQLLHDLETNPS